MIALIGCMAQNRVVGKDNKMPWHLPADLKFFKETTMGYPVVMGRNTFESIGKPLPGRNNIILTRRADYHPEGCDVAHSVESIVQRKEDLFIIGGAEIYQQFMPYADKLYLTVIEQDFEGDAFFPRIDKDEWIIVHEVKGERDDKNPYDYTFITYEKKQ